MLERIAKVIGIETPPPEKLALMDRKCKGKKLSNKDGKSQSDEDARITEVKEGRTHLTYKSEHTEDLDTGAIVSADIYKVDQGDTTTISKTLEFARKILSEIGCTPITSAPTEIIANKGYPVVNGYTRECLAIDVTGSIRPGPVIEAKPYKPWQNVLTRVLTANFLTSVYRWNGPSVRPRLGL